MSAADAAPAGAAAVEVEVRAYEPSRDGPVTLVVEASTADAQVEIGRVGVFPDRPFTAAEPEKAQRFRLPLPASLSASRVRSVTVRVEPTLGTGQAARAEVAGRLVSHR